MVDTTRSGTVSFPQLLDVTTREDAAFPEVWLAAKDGTLWRHGAGPFPPLSAGQEPSPGGVTGLAMGIDDRLWVVTDHRALWLRGTDGGWSAAQVPNGIEPLVDVTVHQGAVWIVRDDGAMWRRPDGEQAFQDMSTLIPFKRLAGRNAGDLWGISLHPSANLFRQTGGIWEPAEGGQDKSWADISVSVEGTVWLVATDGTVWTTTDGTGFLKVSGDGFSRITASAFESPWAVKSDGTLWIWQPEPAAPVPAPAPPPPSPPAPPLPPPTMVRPQLSVSKTGSGDGTVFHITGSGFIAGAEVTIRGARIGPDGVFNFYWSTQASAQPSTGQPSIAVDLPIACVSGISISFSANDGRRDPHDFTDRFWSNTVTTSCP